MVNLLNFPRGLESEFAIAGASICVLRYGLKNPDVLVDLFWPSETFEHLWLAKNLTLWWTNIAMENHHF